MSTPRPGYDQALKRMLTQVLATPYHTLWPLAELMGNVSADATLAVAEQIASAPIPRHEQIELTGLLALLASVRIDRNMIIQALRRSHMIEELWKESSLYEVVLEEGMKKGLRGVARDVVKAHFPAAGDELLERIDAIDDTDVLRRIIVEIGSFPDLAAITAVIDAAQSTTQP
jgi:hypothetical protein